MSRLRGRPLMFAITSACSMGFLLFGYDQGVMGGVIGSESFVERFDNPGALDQGLITGLYDVGCLVGSLATFGFAESLGRKKSIYVGGIVVIIGTVVQCTANTVGHLIAGRIVTGGGVGVMTAIVPTWQAEVSQAGHRGALITVEAAMIIFGFVLSNWFTFAASYATSSVQWILPIALQIIFALYLLLVVPFLVESPRWIAHHHSLDDATAVICRLMDAPEHDPNVLNIRDEIQTALFNEAEGSWSDIFCNGGQQHCRRMLLGVGALYMQQMSGINTVGYYLPVILKDYVGLSQTMAHIIAAVGSMVYLVFSLLPIWLIEKLGRRTWMLWGATAMTLVAAMLCIGLRFELATFTTAMYFLYYCAFAVSYLNVPWMYAPEINALRMRSKGAALASASNWLFNGISVTITPSGLANLGWKYYLIYVAFNASFIPMVYFLYPETRRLSLEQIDHIFEGRGRGLSCFTQGVRESTKALAYRPSSGDVDLSEKSGEYEAKTRADVVEKVEMR